MTVSAVMRRLRGCLHGLDDLYIARAAAKISGQGSAYFILGRSRIVPQQRFRGHDHSRRAEAALRAQFLVKCLLQPARAALRCKSLDGLDAASLRAHRQRDTGQLRLAIDQDGARAAFTAITTGLRSREMRDLAQIVDQEVGLGYGVLPPPPVQSQSKQAFLRLWLGCMHRGTSDPGRKIALSGM